MLDWCNVRVIDCDKSTYYESWIQVKSIRVVYNESYDDKMYMNRWIDQLISVWCMYRIVWTRVVLYDQVITCDYEV